MELYSRPSIQAGRGYFLGSAEASTDRTSYLEQANPRGDEVRYLERDCPQNAVRALVMQRDRAGNGRGARLGLLIPRHRAQSGEVPVEGAATQWGEFDGGDLACVRPLGRGPLTAAEVAKLDEVPNRLREVRLAELKHRRDRRKFGPGEWAKHRTQS